MADYPSSSKTPLEVLGGEKRKIKPYQVFISHRGPETKHSLARHIFDLLDDRGFSVFFDSEEMEAGGEIPDQIREAISTSAVQIVIISPGFGESVWCLKELEMIMQKYRDGSSLVLPVFYGVKPADLRFNKDDVPFWEKFRNKHFKRQSHKTMEEWKEALKELADISGFVWDEHKGKLARMVVETVCTHLNQSPLYIPSHVIGIEKQLTETIEEQLTETIAETIEEKLTETMEDIMKPQGKVTVVSITGIGGIGKTTFAQALFNDVCSHFKRHCFVDDVKGLLEKYGIVHIQKLLLKGLLNLDIPIYNSGNGQYELKEKLGNQKVLLVLDNIDGTERLHDIFPEDFAILRPSSIIIITSRVKCVFKNHYKNIHVQIPRLDFQKSERLFCSQAFGDDKSKFQEEHHMLVKQIVQRCDGIPLALVLFGKHISVLDPSDWTDFLETHRDSLPPDLLDRLRITYDSLGDLQKKLFLDVAIFFRGEEVSLVRNLWADHAYKFETSLDMLKRKLLVEVTEKNCFRMHDILRDLGRTIVDNEDQWNPGGRSRLWRRKDIVSVLSGEQEGTHKVEALSLVSKGSVIWDVDDDGDPCPWKVDAFSTMPSLKMLFLQADCIKGDHSKLPNGLHFLRWTKFPFDAVSIPLKSAKVVDITNGRQKRLWEHRSMEAPTKLRELRLNNCLDLQEIFWNRKFGLLKHIDLCYCSSLRSISHDFTNLLGLECLKLQHCNSLESLPEELGRLNLKVLEISHCEKIKKLPESFGQLRNLQKLFLVHSMLQMLPESFWRLTSLQELDLSHNRELKKLPESFTNLHGLEVLNLTGCRSLEELPECFGQLKNLRELFIGHCFEFERLRESQFSLSQRSKLKQLPESFGDLQQLQVLVLDDCIFLEILPESFGQLTNLQRLSLRGCRELKMLSECFSQLTNLQNLYLANTNLKSLPDSFGQLTNLWDLDLSYNEKLKKLPESFGKLHGLSMLSMRGCINLEMLPDSFGKLTNLHELDLSDNKELKKLPESLGKLQRLRHFSMKGCTNLEMLPDSFGQLTNLQELDLSDNKELKRFPESLGMLKRLWHLSMKGCINLEMLPDSFGQLTNLQELDLSDNKELKNLPESIGRLQQLRRFSMKGCTSLEMLPDSYGQLTHLEEFDIEVDGCYIKEFNYQHFHELMIKAWPIVNLELKECNEPCPGLLGKNACVLNSQFLPDIRTWLEEVPLYPITIMDTYVSDWLPSSKVKDELTSKGGAILKCLFFSLKPNPSSSETWLAEGEHCKIKCFGAAICFDLLFDASGTGAATTPSFAKIDFGRIEYDPIDYTMEGGTSLFSMAVFGSLQEISLDKMSVCVSSESFKGRAGWVCYFPERDEELLRHVRNSFVVECRVPPTIPFL